MKKSTLFAFLLASMVIISSCGGDDSDEVSPTISGNSLSANVSGAVSANFSASGQVQGQNLVQAVTANGALAIVATSTTGQAMTITIAEYTGAGTYPIDVAGGVANIASFTYVNTTTFETKGFAALTGEITVTEADNGIRGSFSYEAESGSEGGATNESISVTNGSFEIVLD